MGTAHSVLLIIALYSVATVYTIPPLGWVIYTPRTRDGPLASPCMRKEKINPGGGGIQGGGGGGGMQK